jgi:hypothetical protein
MADNFNTAENRIELGQDQQASMRGFQDSIHVICIHPIDDQQVWLLADRFEDPLRVLFGRLYK